MGGRPRRAGGARRPGRPGRAAGGLVPGRADSGRHPRDRGGGRVRPAGRGRRLCHRCRRDPGGGGRRPPVHRGRRVRDVGWRPWRPHGDEVAGRRRRGCGGPGRRRGGGAGRVGRSRWDGHRRGRPAGGLRTRSARPRRRRRRRTGATGARRGDPAPDAELPARVHRVGHPACGPATGVRGTGRTGRGRRVPHRLRGERLGRRRPQPGGCRGVRGGCIPGPDRDRPAGVSTSSPPPGPPTAAGVRRWPWWWNTPPTGPHWRWTRVASPRSRHHPPGWTPPRCRSPRPVSSPTTWRRRCWCRAPSCG